MEFRDYEVLFSTEPEGTMKQGWQSGVLRQRAKTTKAGKMLAVASYPIWDTATRRKADEALKEAKEQKGTREAQRKLNARNAQRKLSEKINANFAEGDILLTGTYPEGRGPENDKEAQKNARNFIRRVKTLRKSRELPELKYVYVTEKTESSLHGLRYHHHMILSGDGMNREEVEALWTDKHGGLCNTRRCQWQRTGLTGFAHYITKQTGGEDHGKGQDVATKRRWCCSKNLKVPVATVADKKISRRRVEAIAQDVGKNAQAIFEKLYPGYEFVEAYVKISPFVTGAYIYATMCKREELQEKKGRVKRGKGHIRERSAGGDCGSV